jgi:hypothetical protein
MFGILEVPHQWMLFNTWVPLSYHGHTASVLISIMCLFRFSWHFPRQLISEPDILAQKMCSCTSTERLAPTNYCYIVRASRYAIPVHVCLWCRTPTRMCYPQFSGNCPEIELYQLLLAWTIMRIVCQTSFISQELCVVLSTFIWLRDGALLLPSSVRFQFSMASNFHISQKETSGIDWVIVKPSVAICIILWF